MKKHMKVLINNIDSKHLEKYVVARFDESSHQLWFYGSYKTEERANEVLRELWNGLIVINEEVEDAV